MSHRVIGTPFIFGVPDPLPQVPEGWVISTAENEFLQATDHRGRTWYLTADGFAMRVFPHGENQPELVSLADIAPPPWRVLPASAPDQPHELHFEGEPQISLRGDEGGRLLVHLAAVLNRRGFTAVELQLLKEAV
jgi:hypothetical protein